MMTMCIRLWCSLLKDVSKPHICSIHKIWTRPIETHIAVTLNDTLEAPVLRYYRRSHAYESLNFTPNLNISTNKPVQQEDIQQQIHNAKTLENLTSAATQPGFLHTHACSILKYLGDWVQQNKVTIEQVRSSPNFNEVVQLITDKAEVIPPFYLLLALRGLRAIGTNPEEYSCQTLQTSLRWKMRGMNMSLLVSIFIWQLDNQQTALDKLLLEELRVSIFRRWVEITDPSDALTLFSRTVQAEFPEEFINKIEDALIDLSAVMSVEDQVTCMMLASKLQRRSLPLLRSLSYHLTRSTGKLSPAQAVKVLRGCTTLKYVDGSLFEKLSENLITKLDTLPSSSNATIRSILISIRFLCWKRKDLLSALEDWILRHKEFLCDRDGQALLLALAAVNHQPTNDKEIYELLDELLIELKSPVTTFLDIVWAFVVLQKVKPHHLNTLLAHNLETLNVTQQLKLQQILLWANIVMDMKDPKIHKTLKTLNSQNLKNKNEDLGNSLRDALAQFIPRPKYLKEQTYLENGLYLDAEFVVNDKGEPLPLDQISNTSKTKRIGVMAWDYWSLCIGTTEPELNGSAIISTKLLERIGYTMLHVPHTDFQVRDRTLSKVQYLQSKLQSLINKTWP